MLRRQVGIAEGHGRQGLPEQGAHRAERAVNRVQRVSLRGKALAFPFLVCFKEIKPWVIVHLIPSNESHYASVAHRDIDG
jgi:hypothetical protein